MSFESIEQQASYGIGLNIGQQLRDSGLIDLDAQALLSGLQDSMAGNAPRLEIEKIHNALETLYKRIETKNAEKFGQNAEQGMAFLTENQTKDGVNLTDSGLQFKVLTQGEGAIPKATDRVRVHYTGRLIDGTVFDSSEQRGTPAEFPVNGVIPGWVEALQLMPVGSKWQLYIPSELAYGERGAGAAIPPHSALIFDVELLDIL